MDELAREYRGEVPLETVNEPSAEGSRWSEIYWIISSKKVRQIVALMGVLSTLMPWYLSGTFTFNGQYVSMFSGLLTADNLGFEFAALVFYIGLLMAAYGGKAWSLAGGLFMGAAAIMSTLSVPGYPVWGAGLILGSFVILYSLHPVLDILITLAEPDPIEQ